MWAPSTSASRHYDDLVIARVVQLEILAPRRWPMAVMIVRISSLERILSIRAFCHVEDLARAGGSPGSCVATWLGERPRSRPRRDTTPSAWGPRPSSRRASRGATRPRARSSWRTSSRALARRLPRPRRAQRLGDDGPRTLGVLSKNAPRASLTTVFTIPRLGVAELPSGLPLDCGSFTLTLRASWYRTAQDPRRPMHGTGISR